MKSAQQFTITQSGMIFFILNALQNQTSIEFDYTINGSPATLNIQVLGVMSDGTVDVLDTYTSLTNATRTIALSKLYDSFQLVATWTGGAANGVTIGVAVQTSGPGPSFQGANLLPISGIGSPQGVLAAPVGTLYSNLNGGAGTTLYVKESGTGNTGWVGK